ncbi:hypothetical protein BBP40_003438 [Aspergillus hancockii]|nr:hypothetical protein BBP40_003438 [Aspergillus hancockii]
MHLVKNSGLSAATAISAALRGDRTEKVVGKWHDVKAVECYMWFLMVVTVAHEQIRGKDEHTLNHTGEAGFDTAFDFLKSIIQGTVKVSGKLTKADVARSVEFCTCALQKIEGGCFLPFVSAADRPGENSGPAAAGNSSTSRTYKTMMKIVPHESSDEA